MPKKTKEGINVRKSENFSEWYSQIIQKAEIVDLRLGIKGFIVIRPWGTMIIENMFDLYEEKLQANDHKPTIMPLVIPESNLKKESSHIKGFTPEVFWLEHKKGEDKLALRPTSETVYTPMFKLWARSYNDLPIKVYQRGAVFRYDTKATRPLIRGREFHWIEAHDAFASKLEAEEQVQQDIRMTEEVMHQKFGVPFLAMHRPEWDKFAGAEYTIGSDVPMPDGKLIQQPSTHLMGQKFSKAFDATFKNREGKEEHLWTTAYGPAISRILVSVISMHGDDKGLVLPFSISPLKAVIVPIFKKDSQEKVLKYTREIQSKLKNFKTQVDDRDYSPGWKFNEWEMKGVPFRIEIGEHEMESKTLTLYERVSGEKKKISVDELKNLEKLGEAYDKKLKNKADRFLKDRLVECKTKMELKKAMNSGKVAKVHWCSTGKEGIPCAEIVEKELNAEVRGTLANAREKPSPKTKCIICGKPAREIVYIGRSY